METFFPPHFITPVACFFALLFFFVLTKKKQNLVKNKGKLPPSAPGAFPVIGHLHLFAGGARVPHVTLGALADRCGPIFTVQLGIHRALVVSSWEIARECYTTHDAILLHRPDFAGAKYLAYNYAMFAFSPHGAYWRDTRKVAASELLSARRIERLGHVRVAEVETSLTNLARFWRGQKKPDTSRTGPGGSGPPGPVLVELNKWLHNMSLNIVVRMVAGKRYDADPVSSNDSNDRDEIEKRRCLKALREFFQFLGISVASDAFPILERLDIGGQIKKMKATAKELDSIMSDWLEEHRRKKVAPSTNNLDGHDFMDAMISAVDGKNLGDYEDDTIIKATCLAMIAGGTDTVTVALVWTISLLLNNPHVLKKAQAELDAVIGKKRLAKESDITKLDYLQAVVKESLRTYPPTPLLAPREFVEDCTVAGYHIPKGTRLIPNAWKIQNDPRVYPDPSVFNPDRFLSSEHKDVDVISGTYFALAPFGSGRRGCPGAAFGMQVVHLALASFLHGFEMSRPSDREIDMTESFGLTNMKATPLEVLVKPRIDVLL